MSRLTVIIPVYNDAARLERCLEALVTSTEISDGTAKCIVADNGSTKSPTQLVARFPAVTLVEESRPGSYAARNAAARLANTEYLAFTDSDCVPQLNWIAEAIRILDSSPNVDILVGAIQLFPETAEDKEMVRGIVAYEQATAFRQEYYANVVHFGPTANLIMRQSVFDALEGFNAELLSGGDKEFGIRAWQAGYRLRYTPECVVQHPVRSTSRQLEEKVRRVVGGEHHKAAGRPRRTAVDLARYLFFRPVRALQLIWTNRELAPSEKAAASGVMLRVIGWQATEKLRLMRGSQPQR